MGQAAKDEWAHQDSNLEPRDYAYHYGFRRQRTVCLWSGLCLHRRRIVRCLRVQSLHLPVAGLGSALAGRMIPLEAFAEFTEVLRRAFARRDPLESPALPL